MTGRPWNLSVCIAARGRGFVQITVREAKMNEKQTHREGSTFMYTAPTVLSVLVGGLREDGAPSAVASMV